MDQRRGSGPVLVGIEDPSHVQQLVRTAGDLARLGDGSVRLVTVAVKSRASPVSVFDDETISEEYAPESRALLELAEAPPDVSLDRDVLVARSVARGLLDAVAETDPAALVVGWRGPSRRAETVLGSTIDRLVERAPCDLYVERVGREADGVESVLLAVAGGSHVDAAARVAAAIALRNEASVSVLSVATADIDREEAEGYLEAARSAVAGVSEPPPTIETAVVDGRDPTATIVDAAAGHDVVVLGATRRGPRRAHIAGSVPRGVVERTDRTVVLARDCSTVGGPLHRLRRVLRQ